MQRCRRQWQQPDGVCQCEVERLCVGRKRGMATALKQAVADPRTHRRADARASGAAQHHADVFARSEELMRQAITTLVDAGIADGTVRFDVEPMDLLRTIGGTCLADTGTGQSTRMATLVIDGMRSRARRPDGLPDASS